MLPITIVIPAGMSSVKWLGSNSLLERLLDKLSDVREADVLILAHDLERVNYTVGAGWTESPEHRISQLSETAVPLLSGHPGLNLARYVHGSSTEDHGYVVCHPLYPFLHKERIEQAIADLLNNWKLSVLTLEQPTLSVIKPPLVTTAKELHRCHAVVEACVAVHSNQLGLLSPEKVLCGTVTKFTEIEPIEAVNMLDASGRKIAEALTQYGL